MAQLNENMGATDQTLANARLIAAAPDLLDVARMLVGSRDASAPRFGISDCVMRARAVAVPHTVRLPDIIRVEG